QVEVPGASDSVAQLEPPSLVVTSNPTWGNCSDGTGVDWSRAPTARQCSASAQSILAAYCGVGCWDQLVPPSRLTSEPDGATPTEWQSTVDASRTQEMSVMAPLPVNWDRQVAPPSVVASTTPVHPFPGHNPPPTSHPRLASTKLRPLRKQFAASEQTPSGALVA